MTNLLNLALYQAGWFACVLGAANGGPWWVAGAGVALALSALHVALARERRAEVQIMLAAGLLGAVVDSLLAALGILRYRSGVMAPWLAPVWDVVLWIQFATLLRYALGWLRGRPALAVLFGAVGGPIAFVAGERLGAVAFQPGPQLSLIVLAVVWAVALPPLLKLAGRRNSPPGCYRLPFLRGGRGKKELVRSM